MIKKALYIFILLLFSFTLISCNSNDNNNNQEKDEQEVVIPEETNFEKHTFKLKWYLKVNLDVKEISPNKLSTPKAEDNYDGIVVDFNNKTFTSYMTFPTVINGSQALVRQRGVYFFESGISNLYMSTYYSQTNVINDKSSYNIITKKFEYNGQPEQRSNRYNTLLGMINLIDMITTEAVGEETSYFVVK